MRSGDALPRAQAFIYATVQKPAALLAFLDVFWHLCLPALVPVPQVLLIKEHSASHQRARGTSDTSTLERAAHFD
ncbi:MAG: hypothetical protein WAU45_19760 [Blastocatellia bacterium]